MDTGAHDAAIGAIRRRLAAATNGGWKRWKDHLEDEHNFREHAPNDLATLLAALDAAAARHASLVALAHELVELEHGARGQQMQALNRLGIVVTLDEHLARARTFADKQHARIDALAALGEGGA